MKRYIKSSTNKRTLREYLETNRDRLQGQHLIIADLTPYPGAEPDDQGYTDCPGVLFEGTVDEALKSHPTDFEQNTSGDNFFDQTDLDRCYVIAVKPYSAGESIEIGGFFK